jgi:hypothetical protein
MIKFHSMSEFVALIANVSLALSFVVALVFGVTQVRAASRDRRERLTLEALRNFQSREFAELMHYIIARDLPSTSEELLSLPEHDQVRFIQFAQQMESLGLLVADNFIDIDLVDKTLGSFVTTAWKKYQVMQLDARKELSDPYLAEYFQWLAEQIDKRMQNNKRKPAYQVTQPERV